MGGVAGWMGCIHFSVLVFIDANEIECCVQRYGGVVMVVHVNWVNVIASSGDWEEIEVDAG